MDRVCCRRALRPSLWTMRPTRALFATPPLRSRGQGPNDLSAHECGSALGAALYLPRALRPVRRERSNGADRRKYRSFTDGLTNGSIRPVAALPDQPGTGGERQKPGVGATGKVRHKRSLVAVGYLRSRCFDHEQVRQCQCVLLALPDWVYSPEGLRQPRSRPINFRRSVL